jgi:hypothetical protein
VTIKLVTRSQWGAQPSKGSLTYIDSTRGVKVHYEGSHVPLALANANQHGKCDDRMRTIQASHLNHPTENYADIAYNYVVCPHGYVYEGRGYHKKTGANGTAALNLKDYAVCAMLGNSGLVKPPDAQLNGIVDAIELLRSKGKAGGWVGGHRDGHATACPGDPLYAWVQKGAPRPTIKEDDMALTADDINKVAIATVNHLLAGGGALENSDISRVVAAIGAKPVTVTLTTAQIQAIAASPVLAENIAEKVAAKLATRLAN